MRAAYKNRYGYSVLSIVVNDDARTATLYHGCTAPIGHYVKKSKKDIRQLFNLYRLAGYETEEK